jgi:branched-subunit amino acid transport protein AzlD
MRLNGLTFVMDLLNHNWRVYGRADALQSDTSLFWFVLALVGASVLTRGVPFVLPMKFVQHTKVKAALNLLPPIALTVLVLSAAQADFSQSAERAALAIAGIGFVVVLHLVFRNALVSIFGGTALYMILLQFKETL